MLVHHHVFDGGRRHDSTTRLAGRGGRAEAGLPPMSATERSRASFTRPPACSRSRIARPTAPPHSSPAASRARQSVRRAALRQRQPPRRRRPRPGRRRCRIAGSSRLSACCARLRGVPTVGLPRRVKRGTHCRRRVGAPKNGSPASLLGGNDFGRGVCSIYSITLYCTAPPSALPQRAAGAGSAALEGGHLRDF